MPQVPAKFVVLKPDSTIAYTRSTFPDNDHYFNKGIGAVGYVESDKRFVYQLVGTFEPVKQEAKGPAVGDRFETRDGAYLAFFKYKSKMYDGSFLYYWVLINKLTGDSTDQYPTFTDGRKVENKDQPGDVVGLPIEEDKYNIEFVRSKT